MTDYEKNGLVDLFRQTDAVRRGGPWRLSSGLTSDFYVDVRRVAANPLGALWLADGLLDTFVGRVEACPLHVVAGGVGGALLLGAVMARCGARALDPAAPGAVWVRGTLVREAAKGYGTDVRVEGHLPPDGVRHRAVVIDDVLTTGGSVRVLVEAVRDRLDVTAVAVVVDREEHGAFESLSRDYPTYRLLRRSDLEPHALTERTP